MAKNAAVLTEEDGDEGEGTGAPATTAGDRALTPPRTPAIHTSSDKTPAEQFEIVETDDAGKPIGDGGTADAEEPSLSEEEGGERPLLETQDEDDNRGNREPRPRESRQSRRERQREGKQRMQADNTALKARVAAQEAESKRLRDVLSRIEPQLAEFSEGQIKNQLTQAEEKLTQADEKLAAAKRQLVTALADNDQEALATALDARDNAFIARQQISNTKDRLTAAIAAKREGKGADGQQRRTNGDARTDQAERQTEQQPQLKPLSRQAQALVDDFQQDHPWLDLKSPDPAIKRDSEMAMFLDAQITREGYSPDDDDYWNELEDRMKAAMPHRFKRAATNGNGRAAAPARTNGSAQPAPQRRGPMTGAPAERSAAGKIKVHVSPGRKQGLIDAGVLDDHGKVLNQEKFTRMLRKYADYDRENGLAAQ